MKLRQRPPSRQSDVLLPCDLCPDCEPSYDWLMIGGNPLNVATRRFVDELSAQPSLRLMFRCVGCKRLAYEVGVAR